MKHGRDAFPWRCAAAVLSFLVIHNVLMPGISIAQTNQWQPGPDMSTGRYFFPLVELPSGKLLAAGGVVSGSFFGATAEVLESDATAWTSVNPMPSPHRGKAQGVRLLSGDGTSIARWDFAERRGPAIMTEVGIVSTTDASLRTAVADIDARSAIKSGDVVRCVPGGDKRGGMAVVIRRAADHAFLYVPPGWSEMQHLLRARLEVGP